MTLESNGLSSDLLRLGAEQAAAGKTLGLSPEETFNLQQHLRERGIKQVRAEDNAPDPFGEAPEQAYDDRGMKVGEARRPQDDFRPADAKPGKNSGRNLIVREEKVSNDSLPKEFLTPEELSESNEGRKRGFIDAENLGGPQENNYVRRKATPPSQRNVGPLANGAAYANAFKDPGTGDIILQPDRDIRVNPGAGAPGRGVADALAQLKMGKEQYGSAAFPGMDRAIERLEEDNQPGKVGLQNERKLAAGLVAADARPYNASEIDKIVAAELDNRFGGEFGWNQTVRAMPIDARVRAEAEIRSGLEGKGGQNQLMQLVNEDASIRRAERQGREGDQRGQRILDEMDEIRNIGNVKDHGPSGEVEFVKPVNTPDTAQAVNAPQGPLPRNQQWMVDNLPDFGREGGDSFGYPQVGILEEGKLFADRLRDSGVNVPRAEVRNLAELQQAADFVVKQAAAQGQRLGRYDQAAGGMVFTDNPGIQEVLYKLRYSDNEVQRLANAMNQVEMQGIAGGPNATRAEMFAERVPGGIGRGVKVFGNNPNMRADAGVPLALIKNEKVGRGKAAKGVRAELANIGPEDVVRQLDQAGMLYTQDAAGQKILLPEAANIIAGADAARGDAQMAIQGGLKGEVPRANFIRGDVRQMGRPERVRRFGKQNADAAGKVEANFLAGEEARRRREGGQQIVEIRPNRGGYKPMEFDDVSRTDAGQGFRNVAVPSPKQPIMPAKVAPSMAPDPWAGTGPARMETAIQQPQGGQQLALPPGRSSRPMTSEMKQQLNQLTPAASVQSTDPPGSQFRFSPDYQSRKGRTNREIGRGIERQNLRKRVGGGAAAAAGLTGLAALIGGERDQREQEQY